MNKSLEGLYESLDAHIKNKPKEKIIKPQFINNPNFNPNTVLSTILNIDNISKESMISFIQKYHTKIFESIINNSNNPDIYKLLFNPNFIDNIILGIQNINIEYNEKIIINKIIYEYFQFSNYKQSDLDDKYLILGRYINKDIVPRLMGIGIDERTSIKLCISRYSSQKEEINFKRLNLQMIHSSSNTFRPEIIYSVYDIFTTSVTVLFNTIMYDVYDKTTLDNISEAASEIYSNMNLTACDILNTLSSEDIRKVLISFSSLYRSDKKYNKTRFSMKTLSQSEYARVYAVMDDIESNTDLIIP